MACNGSLYAEDQAFDGIVRNILDSKFYSEVASKDRFVLERVNDKERQIQGIDIVLTNKQFGWQANIDEKASSHYINSKLANFTFELLATENRVGWLLDDKNLTDYYVLSWIHANEEKFPITEKANDYFLHISEKDIQRLIVCVLKKKDILQYLKEFGYDKKRLLEKAYKMVETGETVDYHFKHYGFWFKYSKDNLSEQPVNVVIKKHMLSQLARTITTTRCYEVSRQGVRQLQKLP